MATLAKKDIVDERTSAQRFLDDYDVLTRDNMVLRDENTTLRTENTSLLSEVQMLREELGRMEKRFAHVQGFAVNLTTRLSVIQDTIAVAMKDATAFKIEAVTKEVPEQAKKEVAEVRDIISRLPSNSLPPNKF